MLVEQQHRDENGEDRFQIEKQRAGYCRHALQADEHEDRSHGATHDDDARKERQVRSRQPSLAPDIQASLREQTVTRESLPGTEIQQPREHERLGARKQQLSDGRAGAKKNSGQQPISCPERSFGHEAHHSADSRPELPSASMIRDSADLRTNSLGQYRKPWRMLR